MKIRDILVKRIVDLLLESRHYAEYLQDFPGNMSQHHDTIVSGLSRATDMIILSVYDRLIRGERLVPYHVDMTGDFCHVKLGNCFGGIVADGSIHT